MSVLNRFPPEGWIFPCFNCSHPTFYRSGDDAHAEGHEYNCTTCRKLEQNKEALAGETQATTTPARAAKTQVLGAVALAPTTPALPSPTTPALQSPTTPALTVETVPDAWNSSSVGGYIGQMLSRAFSSHAAVMPDPSTQ